MPVGDVPTSGDPDSFPATITNISDASAKDAASVAIPIEQLADRTMALVPKVYVFDSVPDLDNDVEWTDRPEGAVLYNFQGIGGGGDGGNASGGTGGGGGSSGEYFNVTVPASLVPAGALYVRQGSANNPSFVYDAGATGFLVGGRGGVDGTAGGAGGAAPTGRCAAGGAGAATGGPFAAGVGGYGPGGGGGGDVVTNNGGYSGNGYGAGGGGGGQSGDQGGGGAGGLGGLPAGVAATTTSGVAGTRGVVIITVWVSAH